MMTRIWEEDRWRSFRANVSTEEEISLSLVVPKLTVAAAVVAAAAAAAAAAGKMSFP